MGFFSKKEKQQVAVNENETLARPSATPEETIPAQQTTEDTVPDNGGAGRADNEPVKPKVNVPGQLNEQQLMRLRDAKRLAETKLKNIEDELNRLHDQQEWLRQYNEINVLLGVEKKRLYELNKQASAAAAVWSELERFETFESIQGNFLKKQILEGMSAANKQHRAQIEGQIGDTHLSWEEQQKTQQQVSDKRQEQEDRLHRSQDLLAMGYQATGNITALNMELKSLDAMTAAIAQELDKTDQNIQEKEERLEQIEYELNRQKAGRQSLEVYEQMIVHGESVLLRLDLLQELKDKNSQLKMQLENSVSRQDEENEQLGRLFTEYQEINGQIQTLTDESEVHRTSILGQDSYKMQQRAMELKSRHQMLSSALSLWIHISDGYAAIEVLTVRLNELRLLIEHSDTDIHRLEQEVNQLSNLCHEKEYTYMLSKSQNVIQLRGDLKEGSPCPVCGGSNHPYHSDTMLEQSKLIGEFKTDYELLDAQWHAQESLLHEKRLERAGYVAERAALEKQLIECRQWQQGFVNEWETYAHLDHSFQDCSPTTNMVARHSMLRQLLENTKRDADTAQSELEAFNFHQDAINKTSRELTVLEQKKSDLGVRLNEVNTGCQVMAGQTDRVQGQINSNDEQYGQLYEWLDKIISVPDWTKIWNESHEGLKMQIQQLMENWNVINKKIDDNVQEQITEKTTLDGLLSKKKLIAAIMEKFKSRTESCREQIEELQKQSAQAIGKGDTKSFYDVLYQDMQKARCEEAEEHRHTEEVQMKLSYMQGLEKAYEEIGESMTNEIAMERSVLDHWIQSFNTRNAPVQYAELEQVFAQDNEWGTIRREMRELQQTTALCRAKVDDLQSRLIALQAQGGYTSTHSDDDTLQINLISQREQLLMKRREVFMQLARYDIAMEEHEKAQRRAAAE